ncbi:MAG TPA: hypothetical protein VIL44_07005 [Micromonospora sp.]
MDKDVAREPTTPRAASWRSSLTVGVAAAVALGASVWGVFHAMSGSPPLLLVQPTAVSASPSLAWPVPAAQVDSPSASAPPSTATASPSPSPTPVAPVSRAHSAPPSPRPTATSVAPSSPRASATPQVSARYTSSQAAFGFLATVEVMNQSDEAAYVEVQVTYPRRVWVTQPPPSDVIVEVSGHTVRLSGTRPVPPGSRVQWSFRGRTFTAHRVIPTSCTVNGMPCVR